MIIFNEIISGRIIISYFIEYSTALLIVRVNRVLTLSLSVFILFYYHNNYFDHAVEMHKKLAQIEKQNSYIIITMNHYSKFNKRSTLRQLKYETDGK